MSSVITPSFKGTLKSTRTMAFLPEKLNSLMVILINVLVFVFNLCYSCFLYSALQSYELARIIPNKFYHNLFFDELKMILRQNSVLFVLTFACVIVSLY